MENLSSFNLDTINAKLKSWFVETFSGGKKLDGNLKIVSLGIKKEDYIKALIGLGVAVLFALGIWGYVSYKHFSLNNQLDQLTSLSSYELAQMRSDTLIGSDMNEIRTIDQLVDYYEQNVKIRDKVAGELDFKRSVYSDFLRTILLPSLNIWKNPYTNKVDLSIMGKTYLEKNPYQDIALLNQRSSIIRDSGKNIGGNDVVNMMIWEIKEEENGFFHIPISIDFKSNSKRAFLLLVDKLSQTSNINNIGLLNDFTFHLFDVIREEKAEQIIQLAKQYQIPLSGVNDQRIQGNKVIGQYLYEIIHTGDKVTRFQDSDMLLDNALIDKVIKQSVSCSDAESRESCYFRFRDKYRNLPALAYTLGQRGREKVGLIKEFYANIPPLIAIESFTFDKAEDTGMTLAEQGAYVGKVAFKLYGRGISSDDAKQIGNLLTEQCYGSGAKAQLSLESALKLVDDQLGVISNNLESSDGKVSRIANLIEFKEDLAKDIEEYESLSPYAKLIQNFELLRSLKSLSLCKT